MEYIPHGVCSRLIHVELDGNIVKNVEFVGGCSGNTQGISHLVRGWMSTRRSQGCRESAAEIKRHPARISFLTP